MLVFFVIKWAIKIGNVSYVSKFCELKMRPLRFFGKKNNCLTFVLSALFNNFATLFSLFILTLCNNEGIQNQ